MARFYLKGGKKEASQKVKALADKVGADWFNQDDGGDWEIIIKADFERKKGDEEWPALSINHEKDVTIGYVDSDEDFDSDGSIHSKREMLWVAEQLAKLALIVPRQNKEES